MVSSQNKIVIFIVAVITATSTAQMRFKNCPPVYPMVNMNTTGILGAWYEIEHYTNVYDRYENCVTMSYSMADNDAIKVDHRGLNVFSGGYLYFTTLLHPYVNNSLPVFRIELERNAQPADLLEIVLDTDYTNYEVKCICHITPEAGTLVAVINSRRTTLSAEHMRHAYEVLRRNSISVQPMERLNHERCPDLWRYRLDTGGQ